MTCVKNNDHTRSTQKPSEHKDAKGVLLGNSFGVVNLQPPPKQALYDEDEQGYHTVVAK